MSGDSSFESFPPAQELRPGGAAERRQGAAGQIALEKIWMLHDIEKVS